MLRDASRMLEKERLCWLDVECQLRSVKDHALYVQADAVRKDKILDFVSCIAGSFGDRLYCGSLKESRRTVEF